MAMSRRDKLSIFFFLKKKERTISEMSRNEDLHPAAVENLQKECLQLRLLHTSTSTCTICCLHTPI